MTMQTSHLAIRRLDRPVREWHLPTDAPSPELQAAWRAQEAEHRRLREEFERTSWTPPNPLPDDDEDGFLLSAMESAAFEVWLLQRQGRVAAATVPRWVDHVVECWLIGLGEENGPLGREPTAVSLTLPFVMKGGEFSIRYEREKVRSGVDPDLWTYEAPPVAAREKRARHPSRRSCARVLGDGLLHRVYVPRDAAGCGGPGGRGLQRHPGSRHAGRLSVRDASRGPSAPSAVARLPIPCRRPSGSGRSAPSNWACRIRTRSQPRSSPADRPFSTASTAPESERAGRWRTRPAPRRKNTARA